MESVDDSLNRNKMIDFFAFLVEGLYFYSYSLACTCNRLMKKFCQSPQLTSLINVVHDKLEDHPILKFAVLGAAVTSAIPVILFIVFAITSFTITFAGFLLIEGTVLALGGICMCICLISMIMVMSILGLSVGVIYMTATKLQLF